MISFEEGRARVIAEAQKLRGPRGIVELALQEALGFVLAEEIRTDREYPPFDRSTRDGYAVKASEAVGGKALACAGEIKAGDAVRAALAAGTCVQIMTGAAVPAGADAVVMIEHTRRDGERVAFERDARAGQNIVPRGSEAKAGQIALRAGTRLGYAELAIAAQVGAARVKCVQKPRVAILSTGDEVVDFKETPGAFQIRNSNSVSLSAQVRLAGGEPVYLGNANDTVEDLRAKIAEGLKADGLVLSGGVSMGKYDFVEEALKSFGAEFFFDAVAIRPGKPTVAGRAGKTLVFGLPGNPVSTMVTFQLFVAPALDLLAGAEARPLAFLEATLQEALNERPGLAHFLPGKLEWEDEFPKVRALKWQGSGDIATMAEANCFVLVPAEGELIEKGARVSVLVRKDVL